MPSRVFSFETGLDGGTGFAFLLRTWSPVFGFAPMYQEYFAFAGDVFSLFFSFSSFFFSFFLCNNMFHSFASRLVSPCYVLAYDGTLI